MNFDAALTNFNSKHEWRKLQLKLISACFLMFFFCMACNTAPEIWHVCVNKGITYLYSNVSRESSSVCSIRRPTDELNPFTKNSETDLGLTINAITPLSSTMNFHKNVNLSSFFCHEPQRQTLHIFYGNYEWSNSILLNILPSVVNFPPNEYNSPG